MKKQNERPVFGIAVKVIFIAAVLICWEAAAKAEIFGSKSQMMFPTLEAIWEAFIRNFTVGYGGRSLWAYIGNSMCLLGAGLVIGIALAFVFSGISMISRIFYHIFHLLISVCDLLPGVALLPVVIVIFGINPAVIVFLVVHAVLWPMSRNILDGFQAIPEIYVEAGLNMGLKGPSLLMGVYLPASVSFILSGLKVGWARAWRGLISAEMIFGIASMPGLGLFINQMRTSLNNAEMYATLIVIILIGVIVQYGILEPIERHTAGKWGMTR